MRRREIKRRDKESEEERDKGKREREESVEERDTRIGKFCNSFFTSFLFCFCFELVSHERNLEDYFKTRRILI